MFVGLEPFLLVNHKQYKSSGPPLYNTPTMMPTSRPNTQINPSSFCTPTANQPSVKRRKGSNDVPDAPVTAKRSRGHSTTKHLAIQGKSPIKL